MVKWLVIGNVAAALAEYALPGSRCWVALAVVLVGTLVIDEFIDRRARRVRKQLARIKAGIP